MRLDEITKDEFLSQLKDPRRTKIEAELKKFAAEVVDDDKNPYDVTWDWTADDSAGRPGTFVQISGVARIPIRFKGRNSPVIDPVMDYMLDTFESEYYEEVLNVVTKIDENEPGRRFSFVLELA